MCERRVRRAGGRAALAFSGVLLLAPLVRAQSVEKLLELKGRTERELAALDQRIASPSRAGTAAPGTAAARAASGPPSSPPATLDTLTVDGVGLIVTRDAAPFMRTVVAGMTETMHRSFGEAGRRVARQAHVNARMRLFPDQARRGSLSLVVRIDTTNVSLHGEPWPADSADVVRSLAMALARALHATLDAGLRAWLEVPQPPGADSAELSERAFRLAVSSGSSAVRRCLGGDDRECESVLGLRAPAGDPLTAWYDTGDYPDVVKASGVRGEIERSVGTERFHACIDRREREACAAAVAVIPRGIVKAPLPDNARALLLFTALERGGPGAFDRLVADSASPPVDRLARTAGIAPAELLAAWRARLTVSRPRKAMPTVTISAVALAWILGSFLLSLRNTPWN